MRETLIYALSKGLPAVCAFAGIKVFTSWLTPDEYGAYASQIAAGMILASLGAGWLNLAFLRFYPEWQSRGRETEIQLAAWLGLILSTTAVLLLGLILAGIDHAAGWGLGQRVGGVGWALLIFAAFALANQSLTILRAWRAPWLYAMLSNAISLLRVLGGVLFILAFGAASGSLIAGSCAGVAAASFIALAWLKPQELYRAYAAGTRPDYHPLLRCLKSLLRFGLPLSIGQFASQLLNLSDRLMISLLRNDREAGLYAVTYDIADGVIRIFMLTLMLSAYSAVQERYEQHGRAETEKLATGLSRVYIYCTAPVVMLAFCLGREMVLVFSQETYAEGASLLGWVALGVFFLGLSQYQDLGFHVAHKTGRLAAILTTTAILKIILDCFCIQRWGYAAAAYTTCAAFGLLCLCNSLATRQWLSWSIPWRSVGALAVSLTAMGGALALFGGKASSHALTSLIQQAALGSAVYAAMLWLTGELRIAFRTSR